MTYKASIYVADAYAEYAHFVNSFRAIPSSRDGLKIVQRRILSTLLRAGHHGDYLASAAVVGECMKYYHPHGDSSIYGAAVNMVNDVVPYVKGKGNFGGRAGLINTSPASFRYTKLGISDDGVKYISPLFAHTEYYENENEYQEPKYLPSLYNYALLNGAQGIGVGCVTNIHPFNQRHMKKAIVALINGETPNFLHPISAGGGTHEMSESELHLLNTTGVGRFNVKAKMEWENDKESGQRAIVITEVPNYVNLSKLEFVLRDEIADDLIFIRNESAATQRIVVARNKRIKRITDEELWKKVSLVTSRSLRYSCMVSHNKVTQILTPLQILETSLEYAVKANCCRLNAQLKVLEDDVLFEKVKAPLVEMIKADADRTIIQKKLKLNDDQYSKFSGKSLSAMRKNKDTEVIIGKIDQINVDLKSPKIAYGRSVGVIK